MAEPVTVVRPRSEVYGTPEWLRATTNVVGNSISTGALDCTLAAEHAPELRRYCAENGIPWDGFVEANFRIKNVQFIEHLERGVEVLRAAGREGAITTADAVEAGRRLVEATAAAKPHGGQREGAGRPAAAALEPEGEGNQGSHDYLDSAPVNRSSGYIVSRLKRDAEDHERARELLEAIREGATTPNAAAVEMGWRKRKPTVTLDEHPDRAAVRLVERFGKPWALALARAVLEAEDTHATVDGEAHGASSREHGAWVSG